MDFSSDSGIAFHFKGKIWKYPGAGGWHFVTLPKTISKKIKKADRGIKKAWGSVAVEVLIGKSRWKTSVFPDTKLGTYLLPVKGKVREAEKLKEGQSVEWVIYLPLISPAGSPQKSR